MLDTRILMETILTFIKEIIRFFEHEYFGSLAKSVKPKGLHVTLISKLLIITEKTFMYLICNCINGFVGV